MIGGLASSVIGEPRFTYDIDIDLVIDSESLPSFLSRAKKAGIETSVVRPRDYPSKGQYEQALLRLLKSHRVEAVILAGFMRVLSPAFVRAYRDRILNIHPALLPSFPGMNAVQDAIAHGVQVTGVTVHLVDAGVDSGPILLQEAVAVKLGDTEATLHERIHRMEHALYPRAIALLLQKKFRVVGRKVEIVR